MMKNQLLSTNSNPLNIVFLFYEGMTALDAVGPHEVLSRLPNVVVQHVALKKGLIKTFSKLVIEAEYDFQEIVRADVLLIPGAGNATSLQKYPALLEWIRAIHQTTTWTTSVCTGSLILAAAGILTGKHATTHWAAMDRLGSLGAIPVHERVVEDGKIMTGAGVSAGLDMALLLAAKIAGERVAQTLELGLEYDPHPPFNSGSPQKADKDIYDSLKARLQKVFEEK